MVNTLVRLLRTLLLTGPTTIKDRCHQSLAATTPTTPCFSDMALYRLKILYCHHLLLLLIDELFPRSNNYFNINQISIFNIILGVKRNLRLLHSLLHHLYSSAEFWLLSAQLSAQQFAQCVHARSRCRPELRPLSMKLVSWNLERRRLNRRPPQNNDVETRLTKLAFSTATNFAASCS